MDAQTRMDANAALVALVQCLVRLEALEGFADPVAIGAPEVLDENRFLAARDGADAALIDPAAERRVPLPEIVDDLLHACRPHAEDLGCVAELELVAPLLADPGDKRQLEMARRAPDRLHGLVSALAADYVAPVAA
jgi:carboxylate-amine ligase